MKSTAKTVMEAKNQWVVIGPREESIAIILLNGHNVNTTSNGLLLYP